MEREVQNFVLHKLPTQPTEISSNKILKSTLEDEVISSIPLLFVFCKDFSVTNCPSRQSRTKLSQHICVGILLSKLQFLIYNCILQKGRPAVCRLCRLFVQRYCMLQERPSTRNSIPTIRQCFAKTWAHRWRRHQGRTFKWAQSHNLNIFFCFI